MIKSSTYSSLKAVLFSVTFLFVSQIFGQSFADKKYYLVDSLELDKVSEEDKEILKSSLYKYHNATQDSLKLKHINNIVELTWDEKVWIRYNSWMNNYLTKKLSGVKLKNTPISTKNRLLFSYLAATVNNKAIITHEKGNYVDALNHYLKCIEIQEQIQEQEQTFTHSQQPTTKSSTEVPFDSPVSAVLATRNMLRSRKKQLEKQLKKPSDAAARQPLVSQSQLSQSQLSSANNNAANAATDNVATDNAATDNAVIAAPEIPENTAATPAILAPIE